MESFNQDTLHRIQNNDPTLKVLRITDIATPNPNHGDVGTYLPGSSSSSSCSVSVSGNRAASEFAKLGENIGKNMRLESMCIDGDHHEVLNYDTNRAFAIGIQRNTSIRKLSLCRCDLSREDGTAREILKMFRDYNDGDGNPHLVSISLQRCIMGNGGMHALSSTLIKCKNIEYIRLTEIRGSLRLWDNGHSPFLLNHLLDESLPMLVSSIKKGCFRKLVELDLGHNDIIGSASCKALASCLVKKDDDRYHHGSNNLVTLRLENNLLDGECATVLADALATNTTLKNLYLHGNPIFNDDRVLEDAFSKIVCDTSTINKTYSSNHTLRSFVPWGFWKVPSYLELNRYCGSGSSRANDGDDDGNDDDTKRKQKKYIAIRKIIRHHPFLDMEPFFEWGLKVLPVAIAWFEMARRGCVGVGVDDDSSAIVDRRELSAIYQFTLAMPMMFVGYA